MFTENTLQEKLANPFSKLYRTWPTSLSDPLGAGEPNEN